MNWSQLPSDIKQMIFNNNRQWTSDQIRSNKILYGNVLEEVKVLHEYVKQYDSENNGAEQLEYIMDIKIQNAVDKQDEILFNSYYGIDDSLP